MTKKERMAEALAILLWKSPGLTTENCTYHEFLEQAQWLIDRNVEVAFV